MKNRYTYTLPLLALLLMSTPASAQKSRRNTKANPKAELTAADKEKKLKIDQMTEATQKIVFFDSVVVDKKDILSALNLPEEAGSITTYDKFFGTGTHADAFVYMNEMKNKCYYTLPSTSDFNIYSCDKIDGNWSSPSRLKGLESLGEGSSINYPFMMADGTTLYFAAKGPESIGGYDIFVTRYNPESGLFVKPENIGMPFNSTANDYLYVVDDFDGIGWFVTDRHQPEGKVCIYNFIPAETRETYEDVPEERLKLLAGLHSISATWGNGKARQEALQRLKAIRNRRNSTAHQKLFELVINDSHTYTNFSDFKQKTNAEKYRNVLNLIARKAKLDDTLEKARDYYATASQKEKDKYKSEILRSERQSEQMEIQIEQQTKEIRNSENSVR